MSFCRRIFFAMYDSHSWSNNALISFLNEAMCAAFAQRSPNHTFLANFWTDLLQSIVSRNRKSLKTFESKILGHMPNHQITKVKLLSKGICIHKSKCLFFAKHCQTIVKSCMPARLCIHENLPPHKYYVCTDRR